MISSPKPEKMNCQITVETIFGVSLFRLGPMIIGMISKRMIISPSLHVENFSVGKRRRIINSRRMVGISITDKINQPMIPA